MSALPPTPLLSAVVVSYKTRELTLECLRVLTAELRSLQAEILVVDNASADGSADAVRTAFPEVRLLENAHNAGFGAANNLALRKARGRYLLLLNTDAFPRPEAVRRLVDVLVQNPAAGVVGPRLLHADGSLQQSCFRFPSPAHAWCENLGLTRLGRWFVRLDDYRRWDHATERAVDFVIGACLLLRREVYEQVGGFDERFFMYQEEADWQKRIRDAGWQVLFTPEAEVVHLAGASGKAEPARVSGHFFESLDKYTLKHHGWPGFLLVRGAMLLGCSVRALGWAALALAAPRRRPTAARRARQHLWLVDRQLRTGPPVGGRA